MFRKGLEHVPEPYRRVVEELLRELKEFFGGKLVSLVVYGSVARGDFSAGSDLDLLIVIDGIPRSRLERLELFEHVEERVRPVIEGLGIEVSPVIKSPDEARRITPLYLDLVEDAIIVYDRDGFFERILMKLRAKLKELGAERVRVGKKWYWRLKREYRLGEVISIE